MTSFRFIHAADIHLDSPLRGLPEHDGRAAERIRGATRDAFAALIAQSIEEAVDFLVIAGDLYDGDWRDYRTGLFFVEQMGRLRTAGVPVYLLHGNHDADSSITRKLQLPDNVHRFSSRKPETLKIETLGVALHGRSFPQKAVTDNFAATYPEPIEGCFNIGVLHTALGGIGGHENYAPCALEELVNKGYDYWALGHVHKAQVLNEHPHVVYPGNLQGRHIHEVGEKGARLVTVEDGRVLAVVPMAMDVVRWAEIVVNVEHCDRWEQVVECVRQAMATAVNQQAEGRLLACRVRLQGRTGLHGELLASSTQLMAEAWAAALGLGEEAAWIERVVIETSPAVDPVDEAAQADAVGELRTILAAAAEDPALITGLGDTIQEFVKDIPAEVRRDVEDVLLKAALAGDAPAVVAGASDYLLGRLTQQGART